MPDPDDVAERLIRIETKLDFMLDRYEDHEARIRILEKGDQFNTRISELERWKWSLPATLFTSFSAIIIAVISVI